MISDIIKTLREEKGLSRKEFAQKLGVSPSSISNVESGRFAPGINLLEKISNVFDIPINQLANQVTETQDQADIYSERDRLIGQKIKYYRVLYDITQEELAKKLGYTAPAAISMIERGQRGISKQKLLKFCQLLDIHISDIILPEPSKFLEDEVYNNFMFVHTAPKKPAMYDSIKQLLEIAAKELRS